MISYSEWLKQVQLKNFINGAFVASKGQQTFEVINPATETVIGLAAKANQEDVDLAVSAAKAAFPAWRDMDAVDRGKILLKVSQLIQKYTEVLAYYQSVNCGKPITKTTKGQLPFCADIYRYFAGQSDKIKGSTLQLMHPYVGMTIKEPIGVVAAILPWNNPLYITAWKLAPALAAGCTIVIKPAEQTPYTTLMFCKILEEAGVPHGVVNVVTGQGPTGQLLAAHKGINKVGFTGSTEVGYHIIKNCHKQNLKTVSLQLGGKSAFVVCEDAQIDEAVKTACVVWNNCGQACIANSRCFVHESIYDQFIQRCVKFADTVIHGDPMDPKTNQGPLTCKIQFEKVLWYISQGIREGAKLAVGGERWGNKGYYIKPTIFVDVEDHMRIAREQIFGPVICILKWKDEEEVIKRANSLPFGLGAGVMTPNIDRAIKFVKRLQAGTVFVNHYKYTEACTPFGGYKDSGIGKDLGDQGLQGYLLTKTVIIKTKP